MRGNALDHAAGRKTEDLEMEMEIKFRFKGEVRVVGGFSPNNIPTALAPTEGLEGIDLTCYSVIYVAFGRRGDEKARELQSRASGAIIVYKYEWRNGWGEGILLPDRFNPSRVRFYKTAEQEEAEAKEARKKANESLHEEVANAINGVRVYLAHEGVEVYPEQESFCSGWGVYAKNLGEATAGVEKMRPLWEEWNRRALGAYLRLSGRPNPGNGNIQIFPSPASSAKRVGVCFDHNARKWVIFEKQEDGSWTETVVSECGPPSY
ncbi:MAG: hypothetical protein V2A74_09690 [bacterium]